MPQYTISMVVTDRLYWGGLCSGPWYARFPVPSNWLAIEGLRSVRLYFRVVFRSTIVLRLTFALRHSNLCRIT
jgi:hypothetical protein